MPAADTSAARDFPIPIEPRTRRLESMDILRGLLMVLMALDHARDFFSNIQVDPTDAHESWPLLFFTRWVTHLCAPGFIALAGASVFLQRQRGKSTAELRRLLLTRGLWLVFLEWTVIQFGWSFGFRPFLQVIWAIGISMMGLGLLMGLSTRVIGALGVVIVAGHNLLDPIRAQSLGNFADLWKILHEPGMLTANGHPIALEIYPVLPWFGVICLGYAWGSIAARPGPIRRRISLTLSAAFLAVFVALRSINGYGDSNKFEHLGTVARTLMSLLDVSKYPPSLDYLLVTLGVLLALYAAFDLIAERNLLLIPRRFFETFGRVPFFYYVLHIYLLHLAALLGTMAEGLNWRIWINHILVAPAPPGWGFRLGVVYAAWVAIVLVLYYPCVWFSRLKARRRDWWLSYL